MLFQVHFAVWQAKETSDSERVEPLYLEAVNLTAIDSNEDELVSELWYY